VISKQRN